MLHLSRRKSESQETFGSNHDQADPSGSNQPHLDCTRTGQSELRGTNKAEILVLLFIFYPQLDMFDPIIWRSGWSSRGPGAKGAGKPFTLLVSEMKTDILDQLCQLNLSVKGLNNISDFCGGTISLPLTGW